MHFKLVEKRQVIKETTKINKKSQEASQENASLFNITEKFNKYIEPGMCKSPILKEKLA